MIWLIVLGAAIVVLIAVFAVGRVSTQLARTTATAVYDLAEAVEHVADRLPDRLSAKLSHDDVEQILRWRLNHMRSDGLATTGLADEVARPPDADIRLSSDEDAIDAVIGSAARSDRDLDELDVVVVLDLERGYLEAIGAVGPRMELDGSGGDAEDPGE